MKDTPQITVVTNIYPTETSPHLGTFVRNAANGLIENGWTINILTRSDSHHSKAFSYFVFYISTIKTLAKNPNIAYVHYVSHSILPVIIAKIIRPKIIIVLHFHGSDAFPEESEGTLRRSLKYAMCKLALHMANATICPSEKFKENLISRFSAKHQQIHVNESGGVSHKLFNQQNQGIRRKYSSSYVGRYISGKGAEDAASIFSILSRSQENLNFLMVGDGPKRQLIEEIISDSRPDSINAYPLVAQELLPPLLNECETLIFPSTRSGESLGLIWIEASFCGALPLILKNGITETLLPNNLAEKIACKDLNEMTEKLLHFTNNHIDRYLTAQALKEYLLPKYSSEAVCYRLSEILKTLTK